jgi:hypothetical protein
MTFSRQFLILVQFSLQEGIMGTNSRCRTESGSLQLLPGPEEDRTFPFDLSLDNKAKLEAAVVATEEDGRPPTPNGRKQT